MEKPVDLEPVTKLDAANRQLVTAIWLFFENEDPVAVHTLACAAREIYEKHCLKADITRTFDYVKETNSSITEKDLWNILNGPRNFFKHPGDSLDETVEFSDTFNDFMLLSACHDCGMLVGPKTNPLPMQAYGTWFLTTQVPASGGPPDEDAITADNIGKRLDIAFPGMRYASRSIQKKFGAWLNRQVTSGIDLQLIINEFPRFKQQLQTPDAGS
jgi:hypothetical protein